MCRVEAKELWAQAEAMKAAGASRVVALVKEDIGTEVADFRKDFWGGDVFMDSGKKFYEAIGGGKYHKPHGLASFLALLANPFSKSRTKVALKAADKTPKNLTGEGFIVGGLYVIAANGEPTYAFLEEALGDKAPVKEVIAAVEIAASKKSSFK